MSANITLDLVNQSLNERPLEVGESDTIRITVSYAPVGIAQGLANGQSVTEALQQWIEVAEEAVSVYKKHPQQCELTLSGTLQNENNALQSKLLIALGQQTLNLSKKAQSLSSWLDACAKYHNEAPEEIGFECMESLVNDFEATQTRYEELRQENELLLLQLQQVQEELEKTFIDKQTLQKELTEITSQLEQVKTAKNEVSQRLEQRDNDLEKLEQELAAAQAERVQLERSQEVSAQQQIKDNELEDLKEENELLLLQLQQVQEELEHYFIKCKELEAGGATTPSGPTHISQPTVSRPQATQSDVTDSPAWKVVAPFYTKLDKLIRHLIFKRQAKVVKKSKLFDKKWYAQTYQDVKGFKGGAALHYVAHGAAEGRDPGPEFSSERYWAMNPDVAEKGTNPLVHYELFGKNEGRYY